MEIAHPNKIAIGFMCCPLVSAQTAGPWGIRMIWRGSPDHLYPANLTVFDQKGLRDQDARRPVEALELVGSAIGEGTFIDGPLVKHALGPNHAALAVDHRIAAAVDV